MKSLNADVVITATLRPSLPSLRPSLPPHLYLSICPPTESTSTATNLPELEHLHIPGAPLQLLELDW